MIKERIGVEPLKLPDAERRKYAGGQFASWLLGEGFSNVVFIGNISDALPDQVRPALTAHGVSPSVYEGRMVGMALALLPQQQSTVYLSEPLLNAEWQFWERFCDTIGIPPPNIINNLPSVDKNTFYYPFIGSREFMTRYKLLLAQTIPPAEAFNDKAYMRRLLKNIELGGNLVPGIEIFYIEGENIDDYLKRIINTLIRFASENESRSSLLVKLGRTASGLLTMKLSPEILAVQEQLQSDEFLNSLLEMFIHGGVFYPQNVVVEQCIDFGRRPDGMGDFSLRGFITPQGQFVPFSVGRVISDPKGEYLGMVMVDFGKVEELQKIGLSPSTLQHTAETADRIAKEMFNEGYFGPFSIDFFAQQNNFDPFSIKIHDFNMREGGTTISGLCNSISEKIWGVTGPTLDIELKIASNDEIPLKDLEVIVANLQNLRIFPYSTTFMRYPKNQGGEFVYTLKIMVPNGVQQALTDDEVAQRINSLVDQINTNIPFQGVRFFSPLSVE